LQITKTHIKFF